MKLLKMYNLCVNELASMRFPPHSPRAIVKPKPLARSVGNINLSAWAYQYLITARVSPASTLKHCSFMRLAVSEAFKTYICIRKMIIDKVHHRLRFLTISMSYSYIRLPLACSSLQGLRKGGLLKDTRLFSTAISEASLSLRACRSSCLGQELRGQDSHSVELSEKKVLIYEHLAATSSCALPLTGQGEAEISQIKPKITFTITRSRFPSVCIFSRVAV